MLLERDVSTDVDVREIASGEELEHLNGELESLWKEAFAATPFQSPEWILACVKHLESAQCALLAIWCERRLAGLVPFVRERSADGRAIVRLAGSGRADYLDALVRYGFEHEVRAAAPEFLTQTLSPGDTCDLRQLRAGSPLLTMRVPASWQDTIGADRPCASLSLVTGTRTGVSFREALAADRRLSPFEGALEVIQVRAENFAACFEDVIALHAARWGADGRPGRITDVATGQMHREFACAMLGRGLLRLHVLRHADRGVVAAHYGFLLRGRAYVVLVGFDPECAFADLARSLIVQHAIAEAEREGALAFDFLRDSAIYDSRWSTRATPTFRRQLTVRADPR